uniref:Cilia- and flagella-associated protein 299 n=1 Tax=Otus sunia TaxID=257818 RepID=A0A8C8E9Y2_9STRI
AAGRGVPVPPVPGPPRRGSAAERDAPRRPPSRRQHEPVLPLPPPPPPRPARPRPAGAGTRRGAAGAGGPQRPRAFLLLLLLFLLLLLGGGAEPLPAEPPGAAAGPAVLPGGHRLPSPAAPRRPGGRRPRREPAQSLASVGKELKNNFLQALAEREEANRTGKISSIIFIRDLNSHHQEVSAYIDYAHRLTTDDFEVYFSGKKRLLPRKTDLSFYNWDRNVSTSNSSPNYQVIAENACGLLFKNKSDRKIINVDPKAYPGDDTTRMPVETDLYLHVVIYDHIVRRGI